jgi:hypothetical protein
MVRYYGPANLWISGKNSDGQGMPTGNLDGHVWADVCHCVECKEAYASSLGTNIQDVRDLK